MIQLNIMKESHNVTRNGIYDNIFIVWKIDKFVDIVGIINIIINLCKYIIIVRV